MATRRQRPILKWPGGKYRLLDAILPELPPGKRLVEPFLGSGAVFLNSEYPEYLLADANPDLIAFCAALAAEGDAFIDRCRALFADGNAAETYYARRDRFNAAATDDPDRAALFLYLNRHGYNGLIRYNAGGRFNVPFGTYARPHFPDAEMRFFLDKTRRCRVRFLARDFRETFSLLRPGDVVYCDPPYIPLSATANFTAYAGKTFGTEEQEELARLIGAAAKSGMRAVVSNHACDTSRRLYAGAGAIREFPVRRNISCDGGNRGLAAELLAVF